MQTPVYMSTEPLLIGSTGAEFKAHISAHLKSYGGFRTTVGNSAKESIRERIAQFITLIFKATFPLAFLQKSC